MSRQKESVFSARVKGVLNGLPFCWHIRLPAVLAGLPDRIGVVNGTFFALELKTSAKSPRSKLQKYVLEQITNAGGYARFVYPENLEETKRHLEEFAWRTR